MPDQPASPQIAPLSVQVIASTQFMAPADVPRETDVDGGKALAEFADRACYQSWKKPNPATATNAGYLRHILDVGHLSVLEHGTVTMYLAGVSRSLTHELIRHRHFSDSQPSQPTWPSATLRCKRGRQATRAALPNATETRIVVTGNYRAWRQFVAMRASEHADVEIRDCAVACLRELQRVAANVFADFVIATLADGSEIASSPWQERVSEATSDSGRPASRRPGPAARSADTRDEDGTAIGKSAEGCKHTRTSWHT